jgi:hypothetical protein
VSSLRAFNGGKVIGGDPDLDPGIDMDMEIEAKCKGVDTPECG